MWSEEEKLIATIIAGAGTIAAGINLVTKFMEHLEPIEFAITFLEEVTELSLLP